MASVEELLQMAADTEDTDDELSYVIDEHLRVIAVPERGVVLGVEGDKNVNRVRFAINRYYHGSDLSTFIIRINYENAEGDRNYFTVTERTVDEEQLGFIWTVDADAVAYKGTVHFVVNCFTAAEDGTIDKAYHTTLGSASVLEGMEVDATADTPEVVDLLTRLEHDLSVYVGTFVTQAETAASNAEQSKDAAANSAAAAKASETKAAASAAKAAGSESAAKSSETNAAASQTAAANSATAAKTSETNAANSATKAASSESAAKTSEANAAASQTAAANSAAAAKTSETNAAAQAGIATAKATAAANSATAAASSQTAAKTSENNAATSAAAAEASAKKAAASAGTDKTLSLEDAPADAKAVGDALSGVYSKTEADNKFGTPYTLPAATADTLGGVKIGDGLSVDADGTVSASGGGLSAYPVGSIYQSTDATSPAARFGGTWEQIAANRVLMGASSSHAAGTTVEAGLPNITGTVGLCYSQWDDGKEDTGAFKSDKNRTTTLSGDSGSADFYMVNFAASSSSAVYGRSSTVQPAAYYVYIWRRTA